MAKYRHISYEAQAEQNIRDEASSIARATQTPGQTKQQTKLIAQGIAKGIAEYKKREKARARQLDRDQKRRKRQDAAQTPGEVDKSPADAGAASHKVPLIVAGGIFAVMSAAHLVRFFLGSPVIIGEVSVPALWSLVLSVLGAALASWLVLAARR